MAKTITDANGTSYQLIGTNKILLTNGDDFANFRNLTGTYSVFGGEGDDKILLSNGGDFVDANYGDDVVTGGYGNDTIHGNFGNDALNGARGDDTIYGGHGLDIIQAAAQVGAETDNDSLYGGAHSDTFYFGTANVGNDVINDYETQDYLAFEGKDATDLTIAQNGADTVITFNDGTTGSVTLLNTQAGDVNVQFATDYQSYHDDFYSGTLV